MIIEFIVIKCVFQYFFRSEESVLFQKLEVQLVQVMDGNGENVREKENS